MDIIEIIPWVVGVPAMVITLFRKNRTPFETFSFTFLVCVFLYFAYASIFKGVIVTDFLSILPFHLALLLALCTVYMTSRSVLNYESCVEIMESPFFKFCMVVAAASYFVGAAFLQYYWLQYLVTAMCLILLLAMYLTKKIPGLLIVEIMTVTIIGMAFFFYCIFARSMHGEISLNSIMKTVSTHNVFAVMTVMFLLYVLASRKILDKKHWNRLAKVYLSLFALGFTAHHPEVTAFASPIFKQFLSFSSLTGDLGVVSVSVAAMAKSRISMIV